MAKLTNLPIISGLFLLLLLPIGITVGIHSTIYSTIFAIHLVTLLISAGLGVLTTFKSLREIPGHKRHVLGGLLIIVIASTVILGLLPITAKDALTHHLEVPRIWIEQGKIVQIPWHEWSYYPSLIHLGYAGLLSWGLEWLTPLYHYLYLLALAGVVSGFSSTSLTPTVRGLASALLISIPVVIGLGSTPLVDLPLALYSFLAISLLVQWSEEPGRKGLPLLAGVALGLGAGVKYNGHLAALCIVGLLPILSVRRKIALSNLRTAILIVGLVAAAIAAPWAVRNFSWTGNPVYPLFSGHTGPANQTIETPGLSPLGHRIAIYGESWGELLLTPIRMILIGKDGDPRRFDGVLSPVLLLLFITLFKRKKAPWESYLLLVSISYFVLALLTASWRVRYLTPLFAPCALLAVQGGALLHAEGRKLVAHLAATIHIGWVGAYLSALFLAPGVIEVLTGQIDPYIYRSIKIPEYQIVEATNLEVPKNDGVYLLYTQNLYYLYQPRVISGGHFSERLLVNWIYGADDAQSLSAKLHSEGVEYLLTQRELTLQGMSPLLTNEKKILWNEFQSSLLTEIVTSGPYTLWRVS